MRQRTNEEELDLFADLIEPASEILSDQAVITALQASKPLIAVKWAIKKHKMAVIEMLAKIDDVPVEEYRVTALSLPIKLLALLNEPEMQELFTVQGQKSRGVASGTATENTEDGVQ